MKRLKDAISKGEILFFGAWEGDALVGCCSITVGFSTFDYMPSGTFEDFFICPGGRPCGRAGGCAAAVHCLVSLVGLMGFPRPLERRKILWTKKT